MSCKSQNGWEKSKDCRLSRGFLTGSFCWYASSISLLAQFGLQFEWIKIKGEIHFSETQIRLGLLANKSLVEELKATNNLPDCEALIQTSIEYGIEQAGYLIAAMRCVYSDDNSFTF